MDESNQLFCALRQLWVKASPEELIRQSWIQTLISKLAYPLATMAVEKSLHQIPHLAYNSAHLPRRRADLIIFAKDIHPTYSLYPLLLIECKATPLNARVMRQVVGYNFYLQAPFIATVNQNEARLGWYDSQQQKFCFTEGILPYKTLFEAARQRLNLK